MTDLLIFALGQVLRAAKRLFIMRLMRNLSMF